MTFRFEQTVEGMNLLAAFVAQLVKEAVVFKVAQDKFEVVIELTGGF